MSAGDLPYRDDGQHRAAHPLSGQGGGSRAVQPQGAGDASILSGTLPTPSVKDLLEANAFHLHGQRSIACSLEIQAKIHLFAKYSNWFRQPIRTHFQPSGRQAQHH